MFGQFKPVAFEPYGRRRSRWRLPRWLVLMLLGGAIGVGGLIFVQERYLGPRLSLSEGAELRRSFQDADAARIKLSEQLADTSRKLAAAMGDKKPLYDELAAAKASAQSLQEDLGSIVSSLPPDPRGGTVQVRAGNVTLQNGVLNYDLVLTRAGARPASSGASVPGTLQFTVTGETMGGAPKTHTPPPVALGITGLQVARGTLKLPGDFKPLQASVQILDKSSTQPLGMRVFLVK